MTLLVSSGTLDNDVKGLLGRGTLFWMTVQSPDLKINERTEYSLMDLIEGKFDKKSFVNKFVI